MIKTRKTIQAIALMCILCLNNFALGQSTAQTSDKVTKDVNSDPMLSRIDKMLADWDGASATDVTSGHSGHITALQLEAKVGLVARKVSHKIQKRIRNELARKTLGEERYALLEESCLKKLSSDSESDRILAIRFLGKGLGSPAAESPLAERYQSAMKEIKEGKESTMSSDELFTTAEGLAYLNDGRGKDFLLEALRSEKVPSSWRRRAFYVLPHIDQEQARQSAKTLATSSNSSLAYVAIDALEPRDGTVDTELVNSVQQQLDRLSGSFLNSGKLSYKETVLLGRVANVLQYAARKEALPPDQLAECHKAIRTFFDSDNTLVKTQASMLFATIARDDDAELISKLLASDSEKLQVAAMLALGNCSPQLIANEKQTLIENLNSDSQRIAHFALYALKKGQGEVSGTLFSPAEFEKEKARIAKLYN